MAPTILNAANEVAVHGFLERRIGFLDVPRIVEETLASVANVPLSDLETVVGVDQEARRVAERHMRIAA